VSDWEKDVEALHAARVARLRSERGWLSLVGKIFLSKGEHALDLPDGTRAGTLEIEASRVRFRAASGVDARIDGEKIEDRVLRSDANGRADALTIGGFVLELMERGDTLALRVRDVRELPRPFAGIDRFPLDPRYRVEARLVPHATRVTMLFEGAGEGTIEDSMSSPGILAFDLDGARVEMDALVESGGSRLYIPFRDSTSGNETYGPGRFVYAKMAESVVLDFNTAMLPGCAFTNYATCPIPPPRNRLRVAIRAGEKSYRADPV
jgi:uncharacterized protein (DUF1684 family)